MRTYRNTFLLFLLLCGVCAACGSLPSGSTELQAKITISGGYALYPLVTRWAEEFQRIHPGVSYEIASTGAGRGMEEVLDGKVDIGMISREITQEEHAAGAFQMPVARDAVFVLVNADNPVLAALLEHGITRERLADIYLHGAVTTWGEAVGDPTASGEAIRLYTRSDDCGAGATWGLFLGGAQRDLQGEGRFGDPGMLQAIQADPLGMGYNNLVYAFTPDGGLPEGAVIVPIDVNENGRADPEERISSRQDADRAVDQGVYPAPPARALYLVTRGQPEGVVKEFLTWILTEGQDWITDEGYVPLSDDVLRTTLGSLQ